MEKDDKKNFCPKLDIDGVISSGKQFDLDITLPDDNRDVIYGVVKNCFKEPVPDAVVKLVEIVYEKDKDCEERKPIGHTFTDKDGEFVFGPLCPGKDYSIQVWVNNTKKYKLCAKCHHEGKCLKSDKHDKCDYFLDDIEYNKKYDNNSEKKYMEYKKEEENEAEFKQKYDHNEYDKKFEKDFENDKEIGKNEEKKEYMHFNK